MGLITPEMKSYIEYSLSLFKHLLETQKEPLAQFVNFMDDKKLELNVVENDFMSTSESKTKLAMLMVLSVARPKVKAQVFTSDSWVGVLPPDKSRSEMPSSLRDWPKDLVQSKIVVTCNSMGFMGATLAVPYERKDDQVILSPVDWNFDEHAMQMRSRFAFDLTERKPLLAIAKLMGWDQDIAKLEEAMFNLKPDDLKDWLKKNGFRGATN